MNRRSVSRKFPKALPLLAAGILAVQADTVTAASAPAPDPLSGRVSEAVRHLSAKHSGTVVRVRGRDLHGEINGTGFYIDPAGTVCTIAELVRDAQEIIVSRDGREFPARIAAIDPHSGVAFLKVQVPADREGSASFLPPSPLTNVPALTPVIGIGVTRDDEASDSLGMITGAVNREGEHFLCVPHLTALLPLTEGEAGAPVLDLSGNLLGMVMNGTQSDCRIIPSGALEKLHRDLLRYGKINPGWVGTVVEEAAVPKENSRTRVAGVEPASPAESSGIRRGDMLLSIAGRSIREPEEVLGASFYLSGGESIRIDILRGAEIRSIDLKCAEYPAGTTAVSNREEPSGDVLAGSR